MTQGATHTLLQVLVDESRDANYSDELLITIHQLLSKIGHKGSLIMLQIPANVFG